MRIPTVGWAFFGLAVVILVGYLLNLGIYIGSDTEAFSYNDRPGRILYKKNCRYLYLSGTREIQVGLGSTPGEAEQGFCRPFGNSRD